MRHALAALLFTAPLCAFAAPAVAQTDQGSNPVGGAVMAPFNVAGGVLAAPFGWMGGGTGGMTVPQNTGAPTYSYSTIPPSPAPIGHCDIISGNRVCFATP